MTGQDVTAVVDKVAGYLDVLAAKLGVGVGKVWPWLIKQQVLEGYTTLYTTVLALFSCVIFWLLLWKCMGARLIAVRKSDETYESATRRENCYIAFSTIVVIGTITTTIALGLCIACALPEALRHIVNPEYYALHDIMRMVK